VHHPRGGAPSQPSGPRGSRCGTILRFWRLLAYMRRLSGVCFIDGSPFHRRWCETVRREPYGTCPLKDLTAARRMPLARKNAEIRNSTAEIRAERQITLWRASANGSNRSEETSPRRRFHAKVRPLPQKDNGRGGGSSRPPRKSAHQFGGSGRCRGKRVRGTIATAARRPRGEGNGRGRRAMLATGSICGTIFGRLRGVQRLPAGAMGQ